MKNTNLRDMNTVLTVQEVAEYLRVSEDCVRDMIKKGQLKATIIGNSYRILRKNVIAILED